MNRRYRKTIIAGNWKMNMTASDTKKFADDIKAIMPRAKWCDVVVCVPFVNIPAALKAFKDLRISVGAQNMFYEKSGAYTGEVSADMLKDLGVKYVIIGHSERRQYFGETDFTVNKKVLAALEAGLHPIGKTATAEQAAEVCTSIRTTVRHLYGARIARSITIQYGGSMKPGNAAELLAQPDIDGGLIGGASLKPADFVEIINAANQD